MRPDRGSSFHHAVSPAPQSAGSESRAAAFFDLDRTLMAGSSGFHWARAAYRAGLLTRRQIAADAWANLQFRLRGATDAETDELKLRLGEWLRGRRVRDLERLSPGVLAGVLPRLYPTMLQTAYDHQDAGRPVYICTAASQGTADMLAHVLGFDGAAGSGLEERDGAYTGRFDGPFCYGEGKPVADGPARRPRRPGPRRCPTPTPTPPPTCRCCARSAIPSR